jgi:regulator of protease activity HflC (stomatin/prohibitin superfamily)
MFQSKKKLFVDSEELDNNVYFSKNQIMNKTPISLIIAAIVLVIVLVGTLVTVEFVTIKGNELGVKETWSGGVSEDILQPKTHVISRWTTDIIKYDASSQVFVMNNKLSTTGEKGVGRERDAYLVQSAEGQDMIISLNLRWRIDPAKLVSIHKTVRQDMEEKIIRPVVMRVVKDEATRKKAIDAYSGEGLVELQSNIQAALTGSGEGKELSERGITVENFVIEHIELDPKYIEEIKGKQIATQKTLRAAEEQKAADAEALVAKAKAQAEYNTKLVAQQLLATNMVIQAQADNERVIIAAKAQQQQLEIEAEGQKQKLTLEAEGKKAAMLATAEGTLAMGKAEAASKELMLKAYAVPGSDNWVKTQVADAVAKGFGNIKGYLPSDMTVNLLTGNFQTAVDVLTGNPIIPTGVNTTNP